MQYRLDGQAPLAGGMGVKELELSHPFSDLYAPQIADACLRLGLTLRTAPTGIRPVIPSSRVAGRVLPVRHYGSVDVFFEVMENAEPGDVLVIDNRGMTDESCIGDLTVLEAKASGLRGIVVWGYHRDHEELVRIGFPVFSYGAHLAGPQRLRTRDPQALTSATFGSFNVTREDLVFADADGTIFIPTQQAERVLSVAKKVREGEQRQADRIKAGEKLRDQLHFDEYLTKRAADPAYTFRRHLRDVGGVIEE